MTKAEALVEKLRTSADNMHPHWVAGVLREAAAALSRTPGEAVAWQVQFVDGTWSMALYGKAVADAGLARKAVVANIRPVYAHPAPAAPAGEGSPAQSNLQEAWAAMRMIREAIETLGPVGSMMSEEAVNAFRSPTFMGEAEEIVAGIVKMQAAPAGEIEAADERLLRQLRSLAVALHAKHYANDATGWKPLDDAEGILSQIDNMAAGLSRCAKPDAGSVTQAARAAVERLANVQMNISLEEWGELSGAILTALATAERDATERAAKIAERFMPAGKFVDGQFVAGPNTPHAIAAAIRSGEKA